MEIRGRKVLVLGGAGLVGLAVCRRLLDDEPAALVVCSIDRSGAEQTAALLQAEHPEVKIQAEWGNIFVRQDLKDLSWDELLDTRSRRQALIADVMDPLTGQRKEEILSESTLVRLFAAHQPDAVIDCINTATAFAYKNVYESVAEIRRSLDSADAETMKEVMERHLCKLSTPQLIRHIQILNAICAGQTGWRGPRFYIKIGTTGTGGMGINIPYTHGEEKPSSQLLSKTAMAGAHSLLLFLLGRTPPELPIIKEIKPAAAIGWSAIVYGPIRRRGQEIQLFDCQVEDAFDVHGPAASEKCGDYGVAVPGEILRSVYIDTGENGLFSLGEFTAITHLDQMEFVTPEEIAHSVSLELSGGNSGFDVLAALDQSVMGPTYRAGVLRASARSRMQELVREHEADSIAFELLGPPRLSKLLFEAQLLKLVSSDSIDTAGALSSAELSTRCVDEISDNARLRREALSIGVPVLLPGERILRGPEIKAHNSHEGWIDLTEENMELWRERLLRLRTVVAHEIEADRRLGSSRFGRAFVDPHTGRFTDSFDIGEMVGWIFCTEEGGRRLKH